MSPLQIFARKKREKTPLAMIALSDAPSAQIACEAGIDAILVGDSLGNTALGLESTIPVTMDDIAHHLKAVLRGVKSSSRPDVPVVADMPFGSYATAEIGVQNAVRLMQLGAHAVKIEGTQGGPYGGTGAVFDLCEKAGVPVMGHLGYTPQSSLRFERVVQGRTQQEAASILRQAQHLEKAGCFAVVLEAMTSQLAQTISTELQIATIGIGAGICDGQILVWHDLVGITEKPFKFARAFASTREIWTDAIRAYCSEVEAAQFPAPENGWKMNAEEAEKWAKNQREIGEFDGDPFADTEAEVFEAEKLDEQPF